MTIVSIPLNLPKLEPDNWNKWWYIWKNYSTTLKKIKISPNKGTVPLIGFDVYRSDNFFPTYYADYVNLKVMYPTLYNQIVSLPITIHGARFVSSTANIGEHIDNDYPNWSIKSMFYCEDPNPQWYYTKLDNTEERYLTFPDSTNWWAYHDSVIKHGTIYRKEYPKITLQVFSEVEETAAFVESQMNIFPNYQIEYNIDKYK